MSSKSATVSLNRIGSEVTTEFGTFFCMVSSSIVAHRLGRYALFAFVISPGPRRAPYALHPSVPEQTAPAIAQLLPASEESAFE